MLTLFYRKKAIYPGAAPLDHIKFESFNNQQSWDVQMSAANSFREQGRPVNIISVTRTPKNIGSGRCQTLWYTSEQGNTDTSCKVLSRGDGNWNQLSEQVRQWLNEFVAPHQLVSVSFYEDAHPNLNNHINALICHKAGANPVALARSSASTALPTSGLYTVKSFRGDETSDAVNQAIVFMNSQGG